MVAPVGQAAKAKVNLTSVLDFNQRSQARATSFMAFGPRYEAWICGLVCGFDSVASQLRKGVLSVQL